MSNSEPKWIFAQKFHTDFSEAASKLASRIDALKIGQVPLTTIQSMTSDLANLTKNLGDATGSLPSYDQRQCELRLKALEKSIEALRGASTATDKFSFKRKAKPPAPAVEPSIKLESKLTEPVKRSVTSHCYLSALDVRSSDSSAGISISDLDNCIVNLLSSDKDHTRITALHVQRVSRSIVLLPPIAGSIILHDLTTCVVVVGCHQFRMHNSTTVDVYLESGSDPIIEHCSGIRFGSYPSSLVPPRTLQQGERFAVKDFSHILPTPSPNWGPLPEVGCDEPWPISPLQDQALQDALARWLPVQS